MKVLVGVCAMAAIFVASSDAQQPVITGLLNNYSFAQQGLPNYGIAQGSIFDIFGTNLSDTFTPLQSVPLKTTLADVSANVTVNGTTVPIILYFALPNQVGAILPSRTPVGIGEITITNNSQTSAAYPIQVVPSAFGILTVNGTGFGFAAAFDFTSTPLDFTNTASPGDIISIWGTGLGPVTGDETEIQTPQDLTNIPIEVDIGGLTAKVTYHGRSIYPGLDQINVTVPAGLHDCFVSVVVRTGNVVSNFATIPVEATGGICSDPIFGLSAAQILALSDLGFYIRGAISINKEVTTTPGQAEGAASTVTSTDSASVLFVDAPGDLKYVGNLFAGLGASLGSCAVYEIDSSGKIIGPDFTLGTTLDAGSALNVTGPNGSALMTAADPSRAYFYTAVFDPGFIPSTGGTFTFNHIPNDPESADIKAPIGAAITIPPPLVWTNQSSITSVTRSAGATVTWTGGDPNTYVSIIGSSVLSASPGTGAYFNCSAHVAAGKFTIPPTVLMALPPSATVSANSFLRVGNTTKGQNFTVQGVDIGIISGGWTFTTDLTYQ